MKITYLGHSGFLLEGRHHTVAIDPFLTGNPVARRGPDEVRCHAIVLTHGHADHIGDAAAIALGNDATIYGAFELCGYMGEQGVDRTEPMNPGGKVTAEFGFVALTQAFHSSSFEGRYLGMPCGAVVEIDGVTVYHAGDTGLFSDMELIGSIYRPRIAMLPIGDRFTMGPELAARAAEMIGAEVAIPIHYDTWPPIAQDPAKFRPKGVEVRVMKPEDVWAVE